MRSERKKLTDLNSIPNTTHQKLLSNSRNLAEHTSQFKSSHKGEPKQELFSRPYVPQTEQYPQLQQIVSNTNCTGIHYSAVFPLQQMSEFSQKALAQCSDSQHQPQTNGISDLQMITYEGSKHSATEGYDHRAQIDEYIDIRVHEEEDTDN